MSSLHDASTPRVPSSGDADPALGIISPGVNCWRTAHAPRASLLVDAAEYFARLHASVVKAKRSILIVGWDFDGRIRLRPDVAPDETLGDLLRARVEAEPELEVRVLVWSVAVVHAPGAAAPLLFGTHWERHPRISVRLDSQHPIYAAHHQKIVAIDDEIAYVGGIDLTVRRWDTCDHDRENSLRLSYDGTTYGPVHDLQMVVDGEAARALAEVARRRWEVGTEETIVPRPTGADLWPDGLTPHLVDQQVAISRSAPPWRGTHGVREAAALTRDAILAARRRLYIEAQYLSARYVRAALLASLKRPKGPEILVVLTRSTEGIVERFVMGANSDRLIRRLRKADRHGRFRVCYPVLAAGNGAVGCVEPPERSILVHSKLVIADDVFLRVGSSNFNNRSIGLDTECDVAIEAHDLATADAIRRIREGLIGEHVGATAEAFRAAEVETGSMLAAVDQLNTGRRRLKLFPSMTDDGPTRSVFGTWLLDPARPFEPLWFLHRRKRRRTFPPRRRRRRSGGVSA